MPAREPCGGGEPRAIEGRTPRRARIPHGSRGAPAREPGPARDVAADRAADRRVADAARRDRDVAARARARAGPAARPVRGSRHAAAGRRGGARRHPAGHCARQPGSGVPGRLQPAEGWQVRRGGGGAARLPGAQSAARACAECALLARRGALRAPRLPGGARRLRGHASRLPGHAQVPGRAPESGLLPDRDEATRRGARDCSARVVQEFPDSAAAAEAQARLERLGAQGG